MEFYYIVHVKKVAFESEKLIFICLIVYVVIFTSVLIQSNMLLSEDLYISPKCFKISDVQSRVKLCSVLQFGFTAVCRSHK